MIESPAILDAAVDGGLEGVVACSRERARARDVGKRDPHFANPEDR